MKFFKFLLIFFLCLFVLWGAWALLGVVAGLLYAVVKWAIIIGVVALVGAGAYKLLAGSDVGSRPEL